MRYNIKKKTTADMLLLIGCFLMTLTGCKKVLDEKSDQSLVIPSKVEDVQMLLDTWYAINQRDPGAAIVSADEYYLTPETWQSLDQYERNMYTWQPTDVFAPGANNQWAVTYRNVYACNTALDYLPAITRDNLSEQAWNNAYGQALFLRAKFFFQILSIWSLAYDSAIANSDLGIPLRLTGDFNLPTTRSSVGESYDRVIGDLKKAIPLLPVTPIHALRPSKPAAYGLLARVLLAMRRYPEAGRYADSCLQFRSDLMDYNEPMANAFDLTSEFPFKPFNPEVVYSCNIGYPSAVYYGMIDTTLYGLYESSDWRKKLFFREGGKIQIFRGNYEGNANLFDGIATDEMYLIRAEASAREDQTAQALVDLNWLLQHRYERRSFTPVTDTNATEVLNKILEERRKELVLRGLRWMDIKRLNKEGAGIELSRQLDGATFHLPAGDGRFALAIPADVIQLTGIPDNPR